MAESHLQKHDIAKSFPASGLPQKRVLLFSTARYFLDPYAARLGVFNLDVVAAGSVDEATALAESKPFDLLVTPDILGTEAVSTFVDRIRALHPGRHLPHIIIASNSSSRAIYDWTKREGSNVVFVPPFRDIQMLEAMADAFEIELPAPVRDAFTQWTRIEIAKFFPTKGLPRKRVLLVSQLQGFCQGYGQWLRVFNLEVVVAESVEAATALAESEPFDLLVTFDTLAPTNAFEFTNRLRNIRPGQRLPGIVFAHSPGNNPIRCWERRGETYLVFTKPLRDLQVMEAIADALELDVSALVREAFTGPTKREAAMRYPTEGLPQKRLLLVSWDREFLDEFSGWLSGFNLELITAESIDEAISLAESEPLDLVITAVVLGRMNGMTLVSHLRNIRPGQCLPGIVIAASPADGPIRDWEKYEDYSLVFRPPFRDLELLEAMADGFKIELPAPLRLAFTPWY